MKDNDIRSKTKKKFKVTTDSKHKLKIAPNHLLQDFSTQHSNQIWASDITYVPTKEGWLYLCMVIDVHSRKIVGWTLEDNMRADMVKRAFERAFASRLVLAKAQLKSAIDPQALAAELLTLIQGVLLLGRLYQQPERLKAGFNQVRRHLRSALQGEAV